MIKNIFVILLSILPLLACGSEEIEHSEYAEYYAKYGVEGSIAIYDLKNDTYHFFKKEDCSKRTSPASTYKILNSMIFLEEEIITDIDETVPWDGKWRQSAQWNKPHSLRSAYKHSVVWFYQHHARKVGREAYNKYHDKTNFGNKTIGKLIDNFWLDGSMKISPIEQVDFLKKLYLEELPFSKETYNTVKEIMLYADEDNYQVYAKAGASDTENVGWFVGYYQTNGNTYFFANRIEVPNGFSLMVFAARIQIVDEIMKQNFMVNK